MSESTTAPRTAGRVGVGARALCAVLLAYAENDRPIPTHRELSRMLGVDIRTIARYLAQLRDNNLLELRTEYVRESVVRGDDRVILTRSGALTHVSGGMISHLTALQRGESAVPHARMRIGGGGVLSGSGSPPPESDAHARMAPASDVGMWLVALGVYPAVAAHLESGLLAGHSLADVQADADRLAALGKGVGAMVAHWRVRGIAAAAAAARGPLDATIAAIRQAGQDSLFQLGGDVGDLPQGGEQLDSCDLELGEGDNGQ